MILLSCFVITSVFLSNVDGMTTINQPPFRLPASASNLNHHRILVLGNGFVGKEIASQLDKLQIDYVTTSKSGNGADYQLDLLESCSYSDTEGEDGCKNKIQRIAHNCTALISTIGSIGTANDYAINAACGNVASILGTRNPDENGTSSIQRFVTIGNEQRIRDYLLTTSLSNYAEGKQDAEQRIKEYFPNSFTIIQPNYIYGGDEFSLKPPRIPQKFGSLLESLLGLYPIQALTESLPGIFGMLMGPPISKQRVASAAINAALGIGTSPAMLASRDDIILAAAHRPTMPNLLGGSSTLISEEAHDEHIRTLKQELYDLGDCGGNNDKYHQAIDILEQIEYSLAETKTKPASDPLLYGRWEFCFDVEADLQPGMIKDMLEGRPTPLDPFLTIQDICLKIFQDNGEQKVNVYVSTKVLDGFIPIDLIVKTTVIPKASDPTGTMFLERFEGIKLAGVPLPIPNEWRRGRPLEFSFLDDTMLIARGNGGEPHYLRREADNCDVDLENCYL